MQKYLVQTTDGYKIGIQDKNNFVLLINESYFDNQISKPLHELSSYELNNLDLGPCEQCGSWEEMVLLMPDKDITIFENGVNNFMVFPLAEMYGAPWIIKIKSFN